MVCYLPFSICHEKLLHSPMQKCLICKKTFDDLWCCSTPSTSITLLIYRHICAVIYQVVARLGWNRDDRWLNYAHVCRQQWNPIFMGERGTTMPFEAVCSLSLINFHCQMPDLFPAFEWSAAKISCIFLYAFLNRARFVRLSMTSAQVIELLVLKKQNKK